MAAVLALLAARLQLLAWPSFIGWSAFICVVPLPGVSGVVNSVSGLLFGPAIGAAVFTAAATLGAVGALVVARSALRGPVSRATARWRPQFRALDAAVEKDAFLIIFLLRLSPIVPFAIVSLLLALTPVPLPVYTAATALGALLSAVPFAYAGHLGGVVLSGAHALPGQAQPDAAGLDSAQLWLSVLGLAATVAVSLKLTAVARTALAAAAARHSGSALSCAEEGAAGDDGVACGALGGAGAALRGGSRAAAGIGSAAQQPRQSRD